MASSQVSIPAIGSRWLSDAGNVWVVVQQSYADGFVGVELEGLDGEPDGETYYWHYTSLTGTTMRQLGSVDLA